MSLLGVYAETQTVSYVMAHLQSVTIYINEIQAFCICVCMCSFTGYFLVYILVRRGYVDYDRIPKSHETKISTVQYDQNLI